MAERLKVGDLLAGQLDSMAETARGRLCDDEAVGKMKLDWDFVGDELHAALKTVLDCDLMEFLSTSWARAQELADYADPTRHPPGERSAVAFGVHELTRTIKPIVAITIGPCPSVELEFAFAVTAHFGGVRLAVLDGHIVGGDLGEAWASGELSFHSVPLHPAAESNKLQLPGKFELAAPGVPIPRLPGGKAKAEEAGGAGSAAGPS